MTPREHPWGDQERWWADRVPQMTSEGGEHRVPFRLPGL